MILHSNQYSIGSLARSRQESNLTPISQDIIIKKHENKEYSFNFLRAEQIFEDIYPMVMSNGLFQLTYIGERGHGKTSSASEFATLTEQKGFLTVYGKAEDILPDLKGWIAKVKARLKEHGSPLVTFIIDDMSYSTQTVSDKKGAEFKHFMADIRHVFEEKDEDGKVIFTPKIFIILISHRYHAVPPMLRSSVSWIFVSLDNEDRTDAIKMLPKDKEEQLRLDRIYKFLQEVTVLGPKLKEIMFGSSGKKAIFRWGDDENYGDGRLMMIFHKGKLAIFNAKKTDKTINLENYRFPYTPPVEGEKIIPNSGYRDIECKNCGHTNTTKRSKDVLIQCSICRKVIQKAKETNDDPTTV